MVLLFILSSTNKVFSLIITSDLLFKNSETFWAYIGGQNNIIVVFDLIVSLWLLERDEDVQILFGI